MKRTPVLIYGRKNLSIYLDEQKLIARQTDLGVIAEKTHSYIEDMWQLPMVGLMKLAIEFYKSLTAERIETDDEFEKRASESRNGD